MPADLDAQIDAISQYLAAAKICSVRKDGTEADDCLASLTRQAGKLDLPVVIASSDKDFMQLVSDKVGLMNPGDMERGFWGVQTVIEKTGVRPEQIVDWLSLTGDAVDNIPGVPGCGPKTAARLLSQFGSLDTMLKRVNEISPERLGIQVRQKAETLLRNRNLIQLRDDLPVTLDLMEMENHPADDTELASLYRQWGFKSLADEADARCRSAQQDLFTLARA
jgi:DNA polymerase-1